MPFHLPGAVSSFASALICAGFSWFCGDESALGPFSLRAAASLTLGIARLRFVTVDLAGKIPLRNMLIDLIACTVSLLIILMRSMPAAHEERITTLDLNLLPSATAAGAQRDQSGEAMNVTLRRQCRWR